MADAGSNYSDFVKWQIGLSTAALAGLWAKCELLSAQSLGWRKGLVFFACLLLLCVWSGVAYLRWLYAIPTWKDRLKELSEEIKESLSAERTGELIKKQTLLQQKLDKARKKQKLHTWHFFTLVCFSVVCVTAAAGLAVAAIWPLQPLETAKPAPPPLLARYTVTYSAVHLLADGRKEAHTFLLDQQTGEMWQMVCGPNGMVSFRRILRLDSDGKIEPTQPAR
jgi:nitrate reductase NapE component